MFLYFLGYARTNDGSMANSQDEDTTVCEVVVNAEQQSSIWSAHKAIPLG